ncbi:MAG: SCO family protein, partial [Gammaproteobacteria bacterium]
MIGPMLRVLVVALVMLTGATVWMSNFRQNLPEPQIATILPGLLELPDVSLVDAQGQPFVTTDLENRLTLLFFGFTYCPDICPITLQTLATASDDLRERGIEPPGVVFVSVDPGRDSPDRIRRYLDNFDPTFEGVTGPDGAIEPLTSAL